MKQCAIKYFKFSVSKCPSNLVEFCNTCVYSGFWNEIYLLRGFTCLFLFQVFTALVTDTVLIISIIQFLFSVLKGSSGLVDLWIPCGVLYIPWRVFSPLRDEIEVESLFRFLMFQCACYRFTHIKLYWHTYVYALSTRDTDASPRDVIPRLRPRIV